jgi:hypothetical protein
MVGVMLYIEDPTVTVKCKTATKLFFTLICVQVLAWWFGLWCLMPLSTIF